MADMTENRPGRRRWSKASLFRVKIAAVALSALAFIGGLAGVALGNPATRNAPQPAAQQSVTSRQPAIRSQRGGSSLVMPAQPQFVRPLARTRGS